MLKQLTQSAAGLPCKTTFTWMERPAEYARGLARCIYTWGMFSRGRGEPDSKALDRPRCD